MSAPETLAERFGSVDTLRVERLREILADHYRQRDGIQQNYSDIARAVEGDDERWREVMSQQRDANANLRRVTINRFSNVLSEDWDGRP
ncbi:hypothetical protein FHT44_005075 [Mycolicibacterium sp. BK634]|uniref:hypothetical protein n=1 Tax=Mycolicibacterium sp. BK634 TaxID=2587099 RepID=UPI00161C761C|nr:hypothetical protein [Mycolicibacterium sp. BK634]MBB3752563.1 hypothetical protein [Mycolicibacterium sp. BK634]